MAAKIDAEALQHDRKIHPVETKGRWAGSDAEKLLKKDIKEGRLKYDTNSCQHLLKTSEDNYKENEIVEYDKFRKHIHQEHRGQTEESLYWVGLKDANKKKRMKGKKEQRKGRQKKEKKVNTSQEIWKG
jgi:hypothetical protein